MKRKQPISYIRFCIFSVHIQDSHAVAPLRITERQEYCRDQSSLNRLFGLLPWPIWLTFNHDDVPTTHHLQHLCCIGSILAPGADLRTVLIEQKRDGHACKHQECRNRARPLIPEIRIHLSSKQRECRAEQGPKHRTGRQHRSSIDGICTQVNMCIVAANHESNDQNVQESIR